MTSSPERERISVQIGYPKIDHSVFLTELFPEFPDGRTSGLPRGGTHIYLDFLVSNNSDRDVSIVSMTAQIANDLEGRPSDLPRNVFNLRSGDDALRVSSNPDTPPSGAAYAPVLQGVYADNLTPLTIPFTIPAGHSVRFYARTIALMDWYAFREIDGMFPDNVTTMRALNKALSEKNTNRITGMGRQFSYTFSDSAKAQSY